VNRDITNSINAQTDIIKNSSESSVASVVRLKNINTLTVKPSHASKDGMD
jgi:hypothetical protein